MFSLSSRGEYGRMICCWNKFSHRHVLNIFIRSFIYFKTIEQHCIFKGYFLINMIILLHECYMRLFLCVIKSQYEECRYLSQRLEDHSLASKWVDKEKICLTWDLTLEKIYWQLEINYIAALQLFFIQIMCNRPLKHMNMNI